MALHDYLSTNASLQELSLFAFSFFSKFFKPEQFQYLTNYINTCVTFVQFHIICHGNVYWTLNSHIDTTIDIHIHTCMHPKYSNVTVIIPPLANASLNKLHRNKFPVLRLAQTSCLDLQTYPRYVSHCHQNIHTAFVYTFLRQQLFPIVFHPSWLMCSSMPSLSVTRALSRITRPSLYLWLSSVANSYTQPSFASQFLQETSRTMCRPVNMTRSCTSL